MNDQKDTEFFPTPEDLAVYLTERFMWRIPDAIWHQQDEGGGDATVNVLEPSAGKGAFVRAFCDRFGAATKSVTVTGIDPNFDAPYNLPDNAEWARMSLEELHEALDGERPFDIAGGNPPFSLAEAHLRLLFKMVRTGGRVGFLLRSGFLSSKGRRAFFNLYPPSHVYILAERPSFVWSWKCRNEDNGCGHKWFDEPEVMHKECPQCGMTEGLKFARTDQYDYMFAVWEVGFPKGHKETTMSWISLHGDKEEKENNGT